MKTRFQLKCQKCKDRNGAGLVGEQCDNTTLFFWVCWCCSMKMRGDSPEVGDILTLIPITRRGKNGLQNTTNRWCVVELRERVVCIDGPGALLMDVGENNPRLNLKWIALPTDKDFKWR